MNKLRQKPTGDDAIIANAKFALEFDDRGDDGAGICYEGNELVLMEWTRRSFIGGCECTITKRQPMTHEEALLYWADHQNDKVWMTGAPDRWHIRFLKEIASLMPVNAEELLEQIRQEKAAA